MKAVMNLCSLAFDPRSRDMEPVTMFKEAVKKAEAEFNLPTLLKIWGYVRSENAIEEVAKHLCKTLGGEDWVDFTDDADLFLNEEDPEGGYFTNEMLNRLEMELVYEEALKGVGRNISELYTEEEFLQELENGEINKDIHHEMSQDLAYAKELIDATVPGLESAAEDNYPLFSWIEDEDGNLHNNSHVLELARRFAATLK